MEIEKVIEYLKNADVDTLEYIIKKVNIDEKITKKVSKVCHDKEVFIVVKNDAAERLTIYRGWRDNSIYIYMGGMYDEYGPNSYLVRYSWLKDLGL
jgi:hypothetical protein